MKTLNYPSFDEEKIYWKEQKFVIGVDEVGRGAFAGPIVAAAVIFPLNFIYDKGSMLSLVNDSKKVKPLLRNKLSIEIKDACLYYSISEIGVNVINKVGIGEANKMAFRKAISGVISKSGKENNTFFLLADGFHVKYVRGIGLSNQKGIIKGDQKSFTIAAASIIAKVYRDNIMKDYSDSYPNYFFGANKGYGTQKHRDALREFGMTEIHRYAFCKNSAGVC